MREIYCNQRDEDEVAVSKCLVPVFSRNTGIIVKNVHTTIPKGNMGYDQYTVPHTVAVAPTFVAFLLHDLSRHFFKLLCRTVNSKLPTIPFEFVACTFSDNLFI